MSEFILIVLNILIFYILWLHYRIKKLEAPKRTNPTDVNGNEITFDEMDAMMNYKSSRTFGG